MRLCRCNLRQRRRRILHSPDPRRVGGRADNDEIVVHHIVTLDAEPVGNKPVFGCPGMDENDIPVAVAAVL